MSSTTRLVERIREEYVAMPGLKLTREQACRLWGAGRETCAAALEVLVAEGFLHQTGTGNYVALPRRAGTLLGIDAEQLSAVRCPHCGKRNMVARVQKGLGHGLITSVRCEGCHRIVALNQQSA
jgi:hypothetical protein